MVNILESPVFQKKIETLASELGESYDHVLEEATKCLKELHTVHSPLTNVLGLQLSQYILSRGYNKSIDVNQSQIKALTKMARRHPIAFVMTHKTYLDMFVLAVVLGRYGIPMPYTFAGINMDFMGFGQLARQNGVIFIRRSFKEDSIYKVVLKYFIASLVREKAHFMWALEGTRSRTGKLVWPKMGILKYVMEGEKDAYQKVKYVPVSIVYDLIPDVEDMVLEGRGKVKSPESLMWFINYIKKMDGNFGKISLRFGAPVEKNVKNSVALIVKGKHTTAYSGSLSRFALELAHSINKVTPVTTTSLICITLLANFSLNKRAIENDVLELMSVIQEYKPEALVDRGRPISEAVQVGLNLLRRANLIIQHGDPLEARYVLNSENYIQSRYYATMAFHHLYHLAFIELALLKASNAKPADRNVAFWKEIMDLRSLFKFEFFYSRKDIFSDETEVYLRHLDKDWNTLINTSKRQKISFLKRQKPIVAPAVLQTYIESYRVVAHSLKKWNPKRNFNEKEFIGDCLFLSEELHWQGKIQRVKAISKAFIINGIRLIQNLDLIPTIYDDKKKEIQAFIDQLDNLNERIQVLRDIALEQPSVIKDLIPVENDIVPGTRMENLTQSILESESGKHVGAFFDLDRTLIKSWSAKDFFQTRLFSGKMTRGEVVAQFAGVLVYAMGQGNFAGLASIGAQGVKGIEEKVFIEVGEEAYFKHLADEIYPESRALVNAHLSKGHTVAIISAATPYQVNPIARDLDIEHVLCTRLVVHKGKFTGQIIEPACWGEGKALAAYELARKHDLNMSKSYFYTDSISDAPLLELVGNPVPTNPDTKLSALSFRNNWPVLRFNDEDRPGVINMVRTGVALSSLFPAAFAGIINGATNMSWNEGVNSLMASVGDFVVSAAGIELVVKGKEYLWETRPAVFIFNHQSSADLFIVSKLIRKDATGIAKKELKSFPILGQLMAAAGVIFIDRNNRKKAIEGLKPAIEALKSGTSIIIFPEGTRSKDYKLGPFKKGAFHMAMQAGVPIVPVIIRNAHDAMPRGTNVFRPAAIEVIAKPAIPTTSWNKENLDKHIDEIRNMYLRELGQFGDNDASSNGHAILKNKRTIIDQS